jgi:primosomal protein N' (replication factor Y) (superfamily II helicase)
LSIMMKQINVLLPLALDAPYTYLAPNDAKMGDLVRVPLQNREVDGVVWGEAEGSNLKLKAIIARHDLPPLSPHLLKFITWVADYTLAPIGTILKSALYDVDKLYKESPRLGVVYTGLPLEKATPARLKLMAIIIDGLIRSKTELAREAGVSLSSVNSLVDEGLLHVSPLAPPKPSELLPLLNLPTLSEEQRDAADCLVDLNDDFSVTLLEGVTGSGKTEVYGEAIAETLKKGKQVLLLMPEIALTPGFLARFTSRFGGEPTAWHSSLSEGKRTKAYKHIQSGEARLVIGARSALFLPFANLGLIVIDEEHDGSYKQEEGVRYSARDMAVVRAKIENIPLILTSATPSVETRVNAESGKYHYLKLNARYGAGVLPEIRLIDLRKANLKPGVWISETLKLAVHEALEKGGQALLFINRRGFAPLTLCKGCGERITCPNCKAYLTDHRFKNRMVCHHCGHSVTKPESCFKCEGVEFISVGPGVERLAEEAARTFPDKRILILSSDMAGGITKLREEIGAIERGEVDIIIGTQLVAKGHHFPGLTLVGVIDADLALTQADPRAGERTFQMLKQVTGRAGREASGAVAYLQTYSPDHPVLQAIRTNDSEKFYRTEIAMREAAKLPPFGKLAALIISADSANDAMRYARHIVQKAPANLTVLGPVEAPLALLKNRHRVRILVKAKREIALSRQMREWLEKVEKPKGSVKLDIDIEPVSFM